MANRQWQAWTTDDVAILRQMVAQGKPYDDIMAVLERSFDSIRGACRTQGLRPPKASSPGSKPKQIIATGLARLGDLQLVWTTVDKTNRQHWLALRSALSRDELADHWRRIPPNRINAVLANRAFR
jgi:hypothetical protein